MQASLLEHDDSDGVVQDRLAENDRVELGIDVQRVEDGQNGDWIGSRQRRAKEQAFDDGERESFETE